MRANYCMILMLFSGLVLAQTQTIDTQVSIDKNVKTSLLKGGTIGFSKGLNPRFKSKVKDEDDSNTKNENVSQSIALRFGYQDIKYKKLGWSAFATLGSYEDDSSGTSNGEESLSYRRLSANATLGLTEKAYIYGGFNINQLEDVTIVTEDRDYNVDMKSNIGIQVGGGLIVNENLSLTLAYYQVSNSGELSQWDSFTMSVGSGDVEIPFERSYKVSADISALELGMVYTF